VTVPARGQATRVSVPATRFLASCGSDVGLRRRRNEDAVLGVTWDAPGDGTSTALVLAVADGMGGVAGGDVASRTVMEVLEETLAGRWADRRLSSEADWLDACRAVFEQAPHRLQQRAGHHDDLRRMGTTLTCLAAQAGRAVFGHVGDSRAYLFRDGQLRPLTTDHNAASELASEGHISPAEVATHRGRNVLTRWLGTDSLVAEPELGVLPSQPGDVYLVCSDGLHTMVADDEIAGLLGRASPATQAEVDAWAAALIERANAAGGRDNVSVALGVCLGQ
jgi:protein phosphatase